MLKKIYNEVTREWDTSVEEALKSFIRLPALSPDFDKKWEENGVLLKALEEAKAWAEKQGIKGLRCEIIKDDGFTPCLFIEVDATSDKKFERSVFFYGHLDKQPPNEGWDPDKSAWEPVIQNGRLYGRGAVDDRVVMVEHQTLVAHGRRLLRVEIWMHFITRRAKMHAPCTKMPGRSFPPSGPIPCTVCSEAAGGRACARAPEQHAQHADEREVRGIIDVKELAHRAPFAACAVIAAQQRNGKARTELHERVDLINKEEIHERIHGRPHHEPAHLAAKIAPRLSHV